MVVGPRGLTTNYFKQSGNELAVKTANLFSGFHTHGSIIDELCARNKKCQFTGFR